MYLDEHPDRQHELPIPYTPDTPLPRPPHGYDKKELYDIPHYNGRQHEYQFEFSKKDKIA